MASSSRSPVRMRSALSMAVTKILPSPIRPVWAAAAIKLGMALLAAEALGLGNGDAGHADFVQRFLHFIELERFDDRFDLFHSHGPPALATGHGPSPCRSSKCLVNDLSRIVPEAI